MCRFSPETTWEKYYGRKCLIRAIWPNCIRSVLRIHHLYCCTCTVALSLKEANSVMIAESCNPRLLGSALAADRAICDGTLEVEYLNFYRYAMYFYHRCSANLGITVLCPCSSLLFIFHVLFKTSPLKSKSVVSLCVSVDCLLALWFPYHPNRPEALRDLLSSLWEYTHCLSKKWRQQIIATSQETISLIALRPTII